MKPEIPPAIRPAAPSDLGDITEIYNEAIRNTTATFDTEPKSLARQKTWFERHDSSHPILVVEINQRIVAWGSLSHWDDRCGYAGTAEVSIYVAPEFRGQGLGSRLLSELITRGRQAGLHTLVSRIASGNESSLVIHRKHGFEPAGVLKEVGQKFGKLLDVHYLQLIL